MIVLLSFIVAGLADDAADPDPHPVADPHLVVDPLADVDSRPMLTLGVGHTFEPSTGWTNKLSARTTMDARIAVPLTGRFLAAVSVAFAPGSPVETFEVGSSPGASSSGDSNFIFPQLGSRLVCSADAVWTIGRGAVTGFKGEELRLDVDASGGVAVAVLDDPNLARRRIAAGPRLGVGMNVGLAPRLVARAEASVHGTVLPQARWSQVPPEVTAQDLAWWPRVSVGLTTRIGKSAP